MNKARILLKNVLSSWSGMVIRAAITFVLTPFVLSRLGDERFGVWIIVGSIVGSYGFLDLGMKGGLNQYLTGYIAVEDFQRANETFNSVLVGLAAVAGLILVVSFTMGRLAPLIFEIPPSLTDEVFWCVCLVGTATAIQLLSFPHSVVFMAKQRYELENAVSVFVLLIRSGWTVVALLNGYGLVAISLGVLVGGIVEAILRVAIANRLVSQLVVRPAFASWLSFRETMTFGLWTFLISVSRSASIYFMPLLVGMLLPLEAVTRFGLAARVATEMETLAAAGLMVSYPMLVDLHSRAKQAEVSKLTIDGTRLFQIFLAALSIIGIVWADNFFAVWIGPRNASGASYAGVADIFRVLVLGMVCRQFAGVANQTAKAARLIRPVAILATAEIAVGLALAAAAMPGYGLIGAAYGLLVSAFFLRFLGTTPVGASAIGISMRQFLRAIGVRPLLYSLSLAAVCWGIHEAYPADSYASLAVSGLAAGLAAAVLGIAIGMQRPERDRFVWGQLSRLRG